MELVINGIPKEVEAATVADVIRQYGLEAKMIVVELEGQIVQKDHWADTPVQPAMKIEIVHFVGGG